LSVSGVFRFFRRTGRALALGRGFLLVGGMV
jgi:hypothetical protein